MRALSALSSHLERCGAKLRRTIQSILVFYHDLSNEDRDIGKCEIFVANFYIFINQLFNSFTIGL